MIKIAINGLGRLGRSIFRAGVMRGDVEILLAHDIADGAMIAHLLEYDSVHTSPLRDVSYTPHSPTQGTLSFAHNEKRYTTTLFTNLAREDLDFSSADVVIESSGRFLDSASMDTHLHKGVQKIIISAPATDDTPTFVLGVNHTQYKGESIISNASCTSNALAPIAKVLDSVFGIESGILTTIHSYTYDQNLLDNAHRSDKRRARAAAQNIIPTSTGAAKALYKVLPQLKGKLHGHSVRVPVADVSMVDFSLKLRHNPSADSINQALDNASHAELSGILAIDESFRVSSDFIGDTHSAILARDLTFVLEGGMTKVMAWYDNECGYANRILDMAHYITQG